MRSFCLIALMMMLIWPAGAAELPPDSEYVRVVDGHLSVDGKRQRYWAAIGQLYSKSGVSPKDSPEQVKQKVKLARHGTNVLLDRFEHLGFNAFRLWDAFAEGGDYTVGDGSRMDDVDYFIAEAKKRGFKIWLAGMNRTGDARPGDVDIIEDAATAEAWAKAVREMCRVKGGKIVSGWKLSRNEARIWDPRLEALAIRDMKTIATHKNHHTGLRWCDDPVFAVWELSNEEWWMRRMVGGRWQKLPAFFRNQLIAKWNAYLKDKYKSDAALKKAWNGLLKGESLEKGTVLFAPMAGASKVAVSINDSNKHAIEAVQALEQEYSRDDFSQQRGADVLEFLMDLQLKHKQREEAAIKPLGKATKLSPMIYDTGIGYEAQSQYLHQNADAVAHDAYVNGTGPQLADEMAKVKDAPNAHQRKRLTLGAERKSANVGRWVNWLLKPPGISQGVPWLEHNRVEGKPYLVYETQIQQPAKYRADFPLRLAALAAIQDWDWISWHYFGDAGTTERAKTEEKPFEHKMDITTGGHPQGYHFTYDEVQNAMMRAAGHMFVHGALKPAPNPTVFIYGRKSLYDPMSMDYGGSYGATGMDMLQTVYQHGVRIRIDPSREEDKVIGPVVKFEHRNKHNPYTPTKQITFDWKKGFLELDAPAAVAWTGLMGRIGETIKLDHGVTLSNVRIHNPEGIYSPMDDEKYIAFSLYAEDGKPLAESKQVSVSLVSTSFNTGFRFSEGEKRGSGGNLPVLTARVAGTVEAKAIDGMTYTFRDWHMKKIGEGRVKDGKLVIPYDKPIFVIELER